MQVIEIGIVGKTGGKFFFAAMDRLVEAIDPFLIGKRGMVSGTPAHHDRKDERWEDMEFHCDQREKTVSGSVICPSTHTLK